MYFSRVPILIIAMFVTVLSSNPANAGEQILFQESPEWVVETDLQVALANEKSSEALFVILDKQVKLEKGIKTGFSDFAIRISSPEILRRIGNFLQPSWQPQQGDLIVHRLEIHRGKDVILPLENGFEFQVIRQERNLEKLELNGVLTATAQLPDVQVGDIVRLSASVTSRNPALAGHVQFTNKLIEQAYSDWPNRLRVIWPRTEYVQWKTSIEDHPYKLKKTGRYNDLRMSVFLPEQDEMPANAPNRFRADPFFDATSFRTWEEVSAATAKLYRTDGLIPPGSALDQEIEKIAAAANNPLERTALALQLVQDQVRYLYNGLGFGNYVPQSPMETWKLRYGDCKAKTLLLVAILRRLGIESEPALVATKLQDAVPDRLPAFQVFNHILVRAIVDGKTLWLDGTIVGSRIDDLVDIPSHRYALPVREQGAALESLNIRPIGRPFHNVRTHYDLRGGTALPAIYEISAVLRTEDAKSMGDMGSQLTSDKYREAIDAMVSEYVVGNMVTSSEFSYDNDRGEGTIRGRGISYLNWNMHGDQRRQELSNLVENIGLTATRNKPHWKDIPVKITYPRSYHDKTSFTLPDPVLTKGEAFTVAGKANMDENLAGLNVKRSTRIADNTLYFDERYDTAQWEISANELPLAKKRLAATKQKKVALVAPKSLLEEWQQAEILQDTDYMTALINEFDRLVSRDPENHTVYQQRAYLYQLLGNYDKAVFDLEKSLEIKPDPEVYHWRAELLVGNKPVLAIKDLESALDLDPIHLDSNSKLMEIYLNQGNTKKARNVVENARSRGMSDDKADMLVTNVLQTEGKQEEADALLSRLIDENPNDLSLLNERCWLRGRGNFKLDEALQDCTEAIELAEKPSSYLDSRALIHYRLGNHDAAIDDLNRALRLKPDMHSSRYLRAIVYKEQGQLDEAENDYRAAVHLYKFASQTYDRFDISYK